MANAYQLQLQATQEIDLDAAILSMPNGCVIEVDIYGSLTQSAGSVKQIIATSYGFVGHVFGAWRSQQRDGTVFTVDGTPSIAEADWMGTPDVLRTVAIEFGASFTSNVTLFNEYAGVIRRLRIRDSGGALLHDFDPNLSGGTGTNLTCAITATQIPLIGTYDGSQWVLYDDGAGGPVARTNQTIALAAAIQQAIAAQRQVDTAMRSSITAAKTTQAAIRQAAQRSISTLANIRERIAGLRTLSADILAQATGTPGESTLVDQYHLDIANIDANNASTASIAPAPGSNRLALIFVSWEMGGTRTTQSLTWAGQALTEQITYKSTAGTAENSTAIYVLKEADYPAIAGTVDVTFSQSINNNVSFNVFQLSGVDQANPIDATFTDNSHNTAIPLSVSVPHTAGQRTIAIANEGSGKAMNPTTPEFTYHGNTISDFTIDAWGYDYSDAGTQVHEVAPAGSMTRGLLSVVLINPAASVIGAAVTAIIDMITSIRARAEVQRSIDTSTRESITASQAIDAQVRQRTEQTDPVEAVIRQAMDATRATSTNIRSSISATAQANTDIRSRIAQSQETLAQIRQEAANQVPIQTQIRKSVYASQAANTSIRAKVNGIASILADILEDPNATIVRSYITVTAGIRNRTNKSAQANTAIRDQVSATDILFTGIRTSASTQIGTQAIIRERRTNQASSQAIIRERRNSTTAAQAFIRNLVLEQAAIDAQIRSPQQTSIPLDTGIRTSSKKLLLLDTAILARITKGEAVAAHIQERVTATLTIDVGIFANIDASVQAHEINLTFHSKPVEFDFYSDPIDL